MILKKENINKVAENNAKGAPAFYKSNLAAFSEQNKKIRMYGFIELLPGEEVPYHIHEGESEMYYILSGSGVYNDNGEEIEIIPGSITMTPSGSGHGLKNTGEENLNFMALILLD